MSRFIKERYKDFQSYTPGEQPKDMQYVKLNTNESPFPPAPSVVKALKEADIEGLRRYPDPTGANLKKKIARLYDVEAKNVFLTNGSDDILNFAFMLYNDVGDGLAFPDITYSFYDVIANLHGIEYKEIPLREDMTIDIEQYKGIDKNIVIPNPNAPTGITLSLDDIEEILKTNPNNVVIIDEAYVDFGAESAVQLTKKYNNLLVSQTFSKARSFAGGRLGFAIASRAIIEDLEMIQYSTNPYNVNTMSLLLGEAAIDADEYYQANSKKIIETRAYTVSELEKLGFVSFPSKANFVLAKHNTVSGEEIYTKLKDKGVLIRHFTKERIKDYNRITIGSREEMDFLLAKLKEIL